MILFVNDLIKEGCQVVIKYVVTGEMPPAAVPHWINCPYRLTVNC